jgi:hypothetical protein
MEQLEVLRTVIDRLRHLGIEYMLSGSVAMNFYGQPRMTRDIDIVVVIQATKVDGFVAAFREDFYLDGETVLKEVSTTGMFNVIHNEHIVKVDFILRKDSEYDVIAFERRRSVAIGDSQIMLISPEDLILNKLRWAREGSSEIQKRDVSNILKMTDTIDHDYLGKWSKRLGIDAVLEECLP